MKKTIFRGSCTALVTPMKKDFSVNYDVLADMVDFQINHKTDALIVTGTTGEASTLSDKEQYDIIKFVAERVRGRIPVIAGAGSNNTAHAIMLSNMAKEAGADALLQVTPYYNKTSQSGLVQHFFAIADSVNIPIILYNIPSRTGVNIMPETYLKLAKNPNIVGIKEASGNIAQIENILSLCGDRFDIYSGNDDQITPALALGAKGVISVLSNILPEEVHEICSNFFEHNTEKSINLQLKYFKLIEALFSDVNPIPIKTALNYMGIDAGKCRLPLYKMEKEKSQKLLETLKLYDLC